MADRLRGVALREIDGRVHRMDRGSHNELLMRLPPTSGRLEHGFWSDEQAFLSRADAAHVAKASGQLVPTFDGAYDLKSYMVRWDGRRG